MLCLFIRVYLVPNWYSLCHPLTLVDNFSVGSVQIGDLTLKSQSSAEKWSMTYCQIDSPVYQFNVQGEWTQKKARKKGQLEENPD